MTNNLTQKSLSILEPQGKKRGYQNQSFMMTFPPVTELQFIIQMEVRVQST